MAIRRRSRPDSDSPESLGFERKGMVVWFDPREMVRSGIRVLLGLVFGAYADKREVMAALKKPSVHDYSGQDEIWIDFIADLGDGWDSTYSMAYLLAQKELAIEGLGTPSTIPRGEILVMGGDQVYPTPTWREYRDRLVGPYASALWCRPETDSAGPDLRRPHLFAIPGNHDWYDGLTAFIRQFCQEHLIGQWQTKQARSYFAIKLPGRWWLWGTDIQLESYIDEPQLDYFREVGAQLRAGDRVILCTAKPSWVYEALGDGDSCYDNLAFFEDHTIRFRQAKLAVVLAGDLHHYCRYEGITTDRQQKFTAGGGGAYLSGTHHLPDTIQLEERHFAVKGQNVSASSVEQWYDRRACYPSPNTSRRLMRGCLRFPWQNWPFALTLGFIYLLFAWALQSASQAVSPSVDKSFIVAVSRLPFTLKGFAGVVTEFWWAAAHSPDTTVFALALIAGCVVLCQTTKTRLRVSIGVTHGVVHLVVMVLLLWGLVTVNLGLLNLDVGDPKSAIRHSVVLGGEMLTLGSLLGGLLMGVYLLVTNKLFGIHHNEVFAAQSIPDYKNFLRMHLSGDGALTIYPIGVKKVCRKWRFVKSAAPDQPCQPLFEPETTPPIPHLIEPPIRLG